MTNIVTAMGQASADSTPMLVISSVNRSHQLGMGLYRIQQRAPGAGAIRAKAAVVELACKLGAPVINAVNAKGIIPYSHALVVGGSGSCSAIRDELKSADNRRYRRYSLPQCRFGQRQR